MTTTWQARLHAWYLKFWNWMSGSGTILWTRFLFVANTVLGVLVVVDASALPWFKAHPEYLVYWNMFAAIVGELIRKSGTDYEMRPVYVPDYGTVETVKLVPKPLDPPEAAPVVTGDDHV